MIANELVCNLCKQWCQVLACYRSEHKAYVVGSSYLLCAPHAQKGGYCRRIYNSLYSSQRP